MARAYLDVDDDIAALATSPGPGALAVIRVAGPSALKRLARVFSRPKALSSSKGHAALLGRILKAAGQDDADTNSADQAMVLVFRAPASYTGQDGADIMCHGGSAGVELVLAALDSAGFRRALPGEFTFRAFMNGKLDLAEAEAVNELVSARTAAAHDDALARLSGGLSAELASAKERLTKAAAACAVGLDYGEDEAPDAFTGSLGELESLAASLQALADSWRVGRLLRDGALVVLAGGTNAGKSSLYNRLLKEERAIVSELHGTTRDSLEAQLDLDGLPVRLLDTAGLRDSPDPVEREGVRRSRLQAEGADLVLYVVDAVRGLRPDDRAFLDGHEGALLVWNKVDDPAAGPAPGGWLPVSAKTGLGERELVRAVRAALMGPGASAQAAAGTRVSTARQADALRRAAAACRSALAAAGSGLALDMVALDLAEALAALGELTGETAPEDVLDAMFSGFCVGK